VSQAKARVDALDDHLWLLQTEPAYFRRHLLMLEQTMIIASFQGKLVSKELLAIKVMSELKVHWCWRDLLEAFEQARDLHHRFRDSIHPGSPLPKKADNQLGALGLQVVNILRSITYKLVQVLPQKPGFAHWHKSKYEHDEKSGIMVTDMKKKPGVTASLLFNEDPLYWCLLQLQGAPDDPQAFHKPMLFSSSTSIWPWLPKQSVHDYKSLFMEKSLILPFYTKCLPLYDVIA
jgi:hypothetical protein